MLNLFKPKMALIVEVDEATCFENAGEYITSIIDKIKQEYGRTHTLVVEIKIRA